MSLFRFADLRNVTKKLGKTRGRRSRPEREMPKSRKPRRLLMDSLEQRQLLSVTVADWEDILVSQPSGYYMFQDNPGLSNDLYVARPGGYVALTSVPYDDPLTPQLEQYSEIISAFGNPETLAGQSIGTDADGDFVVTYTRDDLVMRLLKNPNGSVVLDSATGLPVYEPVLDPRTGNPMVDQNIYARYFTDEVQRLTLPALSELDLDPTNSQYAHFSLRVGGTEVQKIKITSSNSPWSGETYPAGSFELGFDVNGDGTVTAAETATVAGYDSTLLPSYNALLIQNALDGIGGALDGVVVEAVNSQEFIIKFPEVSLNYQFGGGVNGNVPDIVVPSFAGLSGFYPAVLVETVSEPFVVRNIPLFPDSPADTARAIESYFRQVQVDERLTTTRNYAPVDYPPQDRASGPGSSTDSPRTQPLTTAPIPLADIEVRAINATTFDITFTGFSGKKDHPEIIIEDVRNDFNNPNSSTGDPLAFLSDIDTLKAPSAEFRVNPLELKDDPATPWPDVYSQSRPGIAMDADGDFVIVWQSEVPDSLNLGSKFDVYGRQFAPLAMVADPAAVPGFITPGIRAMAATQVIVFDSQVVTDLTGTFQLRVGGQLTGVIPFDSTKLDETAGVIRAELVALGYTQAEVRILQPSDPFRLEIAFPTANGSVDQPPIEYVAIPGGLAAKVSFEGLPGDLFTFRANTFTVNEQWEPAVGMDALGNFTVAWRTGGQDLSFFNGIKAQKFNRHGQRIGVEWEVSNETTQIDFDPYVAMSADGQTLITWVRTSDPDYVIGEGFTASVLGELYAPTAAGDPPVPIPIVNQFGLPGAGNPTAAFDRNNNFLVTSDAIFDNDAVGGASTGVHGIMYRYDGAGGLTVVRGEFRANSSSFNTGAATLWPFEQLNSQAGLDADGDMFISYEGHGPDASVETRLNGTFYRDLINSQKNADLLPYFNPATQNLTYGNFGPGTSSPWGNEGDVDRIIETVLISAYKQGATSEQIGRLRALLEERASLLRGGSSDILLSRYDAIPGSAPQTLFGDSIINATREGRNTRIYLRFLKTTTGGNFGLQMATPWGTQTATVTPRIVNGIIDPVGTADDMDGQIEAALGSSWPGGGDVYGNARVRLMNTVAGGFNDEITWRQGTPWEIYPTMPQFDPVTYYVYEVTFQGDVHDIYINTGVSGNTLAPGQNPTPTEFVWGTEAFVQELFEANPARISSLRFPHHTQASMGVEPDGDYVLAWTDIYSRETIWDHTLNNSVFDNKSSAIYYRRFNENTDTAGPQVTDMVDAEGKRVDAGAVLTASLNNYIVLTFDEDMLNSGQDAVTDLDNYRLLANGVELTGGIVHIDYGLNKAAEIFGTLPTNKWEAVLTLDGQPLDPAQSALKPGNYTIEALAPTLDGSSTGLRDLRGNPLNYTGFTATTYGQSFSRNFTISVTAGNDQGVDTGTAGGTTYPESARAVAVDANGDHVVTWSAIDTTLGVERVFVRIYDTDGTPSDVTPNAFQVTPIVDEPGFINDTQRYATVAADKDGDFIVTWTNYRGGDADIYARRYKADGTALGKAFRVNAIGTSESGSPTAQKWSQVAADVDGDFVITWSSELGGQGGSGQGFDVYARRFSGEVLFDTEGNIAEPQSATASEFLVNQSTVGNQLVSSVSMDATGRFVISWISSVSNNDDVFARVFTAQGVGDAAFNAGNEFLVNTTTAGNQKFANVGMDLSGDNFVVTWSSSNQDGDGYGVYAQRFNRAAGGPVGGEFRVNTTTEWDQMYSSVAMDHQGDFVITWSGRGTQPGQEDKNLMGVFYQRYSANGAPAPQGETRVNQSTAGDQKYSSIGSDGFGNVIIVWTGLGAQPGTTAIYKFSSVNNDPLNDNDGPIVTDVSRADNFRTRIIDGSTIEKGANGLAEIVVSFGENLSTAGGLTGLSSVLNPANWQLKKNNSVIVGGISAINFGYNPATRKFEARLTLDENGSAQGTMPLTEGVYELLVRDTITDGLNRLDGNFDGVPGSGALPGYQHRFTISSVQGSDVPISDNLGNAQTYAGASKSVAVDADGDYVSVFSVFDTAASRDRVYLRMFSANGNPASTMPAAFWVNAGDANSASFSGDHQRFGTVAADKDGDFIVTWTNYRGTDSDIYARRFRANGTPLGDSFRVNTLGTSDSGSPTKQKWSQVAADADGDFVITWASEQLGQPGEPTQGFDIYARRYSSRITESAGKINPPTASTASEFLVNTTTAGNQQTPTIAMAANGRFVIAWTSNDDVLARVFDPQGLPDPILGTEFVVAGGAGLQYYPNVAMNLAGNRFVVAWSDSVADTSGTGVFARIYDNNGPLAANPNAFQVNTTIESDQTYAAVAMDHQGDFTIAWTGHGNQPGQEDQDQFGVYYQRFLADGTPDTFNQQLQETRANRSTPGPQRLPSVGSDGEGNIVIVWTGQGSSVGSTAIYKFDSVLTQPAADDDGPIVTDVALNDTSRTRVHSGDSLNVGDTGLAQLVVMFGESMSTFGGAIGAESVTNPANWILTRDGTPIDGAISSVTFGLNAATRKYEAILTLDGNGTQAGVVPLTTQGQYVLTVRDLMTDGRNRLDGNFDAVPATGSQQGYQHGFFLVTSGTPGTDDPANAVNGAAKSAWNYPESRRTVAVDADGDYVVVWTAPDTIKDANGVDVTVDRLFMRRFNADNTPQSAVLPVSFTSAVKGGQRFGAVAADEDGDYVVTWTQYDTVNGQVQADIYARRFTAGGVALGNHFRVNTYTLSDQKWSVVDVNAHGDFIITWSSLGQEDGGQMGTGYGVYARRFDSYGQPLGQEFQVNITKEGDQKYSSVAIDDMGGFVVTWTSDQGGVGTDIVARQYWQDGSPQPSALGVGYNFGEIMVNQVTSGNQNFPDVAMNAAGTSYIVTWSGPDGNNNGIFGRQFTREVAENVDPRALFNSQLPNAGLPIPNITPNTVPLSTTITVDQSFQITDVDVRVNITHPRVSDLTLVLVSPTGVRITLADQVPRDTNRVPPELPGADYRDTIFDDEAATAINQYPAAQTPFTGRFRPAPGLLTAFDGLNARGTWTLEILDNRAGPYDPADPDPTNPAPLPAFLKSWSLDLGVGLQASDEFRVNTSDVGDQNYPSIGMDRSGQFVIAWSGPGSQQFQVDNSSGGVYYQRYNAGGGRIGTEIRANKQTSGAQRFPSVDMDADGNFVLVWMGPTTQTGVTAVYRSSVQVGATDNQGPLATEVLVPNDAAGSLSNDARRMIDGDVRLPSAFYNPVTKQIELQVVFNEELSTRQSDSDGDGVLDQPGPDSVLNLDNWSLARNGVDMTGAIKSVSFQNDATARKWIAVVTLDPNVVAQKGLLRDGEYTLTIYDGVQDSYAHLAGDSFFGGNSIDGDFDGVPGTEIGSGTGASGFRFQFNVSSTEPQLGAERRVNQATGPEQRFSQSYGTGYGREESTRSVAVDHDGDFVVVWTSYDPADPANGDVYMRLYDRNDNPLTGDIRVNTTTAGHQRNASVAMDADGDFVVVWESQGQDSDGSTGIFGRRFSSAGQALGGEFRVHTSTAGEQINPEVATDHFGNFVVVWATQGQPLSYFNDIRGQLFDYQGTRLGSEFLVNDVNIPSIVGVEVNPTVGMDVDGDFVVAWDRTTAHSNGVVLDSTIFARLFTPDGTPKAPEFQVATGTTGNTDPTHDAGDSVGGNDIRRRARNPQIGMDSAGNFIIVWEAFQDEDLAAAAGADSYGVYFQRFDVNGVAQFADDHQANLVISTQANSPTLDTTINSDQFAFGQVNPSVAMDADGDYAIVWNGNGAVPHPVDPANLPTVNRDSDGVWIRSFHAQNGAGPEFRSVQTRVNETAGGVQQFPTIGMTRNGESVVVWNGWGVGDRHGIFVRRYRELNGQGQVIDNAGPMVSDIQLQIAGLPADRIMENEQVTATVKTLVVTFDEAMQDTADPRSSNWRYSVRNPANYRLLKNGVELTAGISSIDYRLNPATNKWEAVLNLDGNGAGPDVTPLETGHYQLQALNTLRDVAGNPLASDGFPGNANGAPFVRNFFVASAGTPEVPVGGGGTTGDHYFQPDSLAGSPYTPLDGRTAPNSPQAIAGDADGDHVVVWTSNVAGEQGVWAALYTTEITLSGENRVVTTKLLKQFRIAASSTAEYASVARDADGDFVVTWSQKTAASDWDVFAAKYDANGNAQGLPFRVNTYIANAQRFSSVAMDNDGDFVIAWQSHKQDGSGYGIYAQRYTPAGVPVGGNSELQSISFVGQTTGTFQLSWDANADGTITSNEITRSVSYNGTAAAIASQVQAELQRLGAEVEVTAVAQGELMVRFVGQYANRNVAEIAVQSANLTGTGASMAVTTRRDGSGGEFLVNETTQYDQVHPSVAMDANGQFVVSWTSFTANGETDIYARRFASNDAIQGGGSGTGGSATVQNPLGNQYVPYMSVSGINPNSPTYLVTPGTALGRELDGVVLVNAGGALGSGSLLSTGRHILTAAHVVDAGGGQPVPAAQVSVTFDLATGPVTIPASQIFINPLYSGALNVVGDIAIIELATTAPIEADRYEIYRGADEVGKTFELVGYGLYGTGVLPQQGNDGLKRHGYNTYESTGGLFNPRLQALNLPGFNVMGDSLLVYDFDNGTAENDAFGRLYNIKNTGLGQLEVGAAPGDSGGPNFIIGADGKRRIATVVSGGFTSATLQAVLANPGAPIDPTGATDASFGDFGFDTRVSAYASWIDDILGGSGGEFLVNEDAPVLDPVTGLPVIDPITGLPVVVANQAGEQKWSAVAMDSDGDFVVTWTSVGQDGTSVTAAEGVYARRYDTGGGAASNVFQVNKTTDLAQQRSRVAMDSDGDFIVTWESFQDRGTSDEPSSFGVYAQRYVRNEMVGQDPFLGVNGEIGTEFAINTTIAGDQRFPSATMSAGGDITIAWTGPGQGGEAVFTRSFPRSDDVVGAVVSDVINVNGMGQILEGSSIALSPGTVTRLIVRFSEELSTQALAGGAHSILNPNNWILTKDGKTISQGVQGIQFGRNKAFGLGLMATPSQAFEAVVTLDGDAAAAGAQSLAMGSYTLTIRDQVWDLFDNALDGDLDGTAGGNFIRTFRVAGAGDNSGGVSPGGPGIPSAVEQQLPVNIGWYQDQIEPAIASDSEGNFVVVWTSFADDPDPDTNPLTNDIGKIVAQRFDRYGRPVGQPIDVTAGAVGWSGKQERPDVAMDPYGNFVVVWSGQGPGDNEGVFGRLFDSFGNAVADPFAVNVYRSNSQRTPSVAMDASGQFVVTWTSYGQDDNPGVVDKLDIYARRFDNFGQALGGEFQVNRTAENLQDFSDVAMDNSGQFVVVWNSYGQDGSKWGVYGQRFNAQGFAMGGEFAVNTSTTEDQVYPEVAMDADGDFVVAWASAHRLLTDGYDVYFRRYSRDGAAQGGEVRANSTVANWQHQPSVAMDAGGNFVVTWSSMGQEATIGSEGSNQPVNDYGIFARMYNFNGTEYTDPVTKAPYGEFQVNAVTLGNQTNPVVTRDADGDFSVAWVGPDYQGKGIFSRTMHLNRAGTTVQPPANQTELRLVGTGAADTFEFIAGMSPSSWIVKVNGVTKSVGAQVNAIYFDGLGGQDTILVTGTNADEEVQLDVGLLKFIHPNFRLEASNFEIVTIDGRGGKDTSILTDSPNDDRFKADPITAVLSGPGFVHTLTNFEGNFAYARNGGKDLAELYDSNGNDVFVATPTYAIMRAEDNSYINRAKFFYSAHGYSKGDGYDTAKFEDTPGRDRLKIQGHEVRLFNDQGYFVRSKFFDNVTVNAKNGGNDWIEMYDTSGDDYAVVIPRRVDFTAAAGLGSNVVARGFEDVYARSRNGTNDFDTIEIHGTTLDDNLLMIGGQAWVTGHMKVNATNWNHVKAYGGGGNDIAEIHDAVIEQATGELTAVRSPKTRMAWLYEFEQIQRRDDPNKPDANLQATDLVFSALWGQQ